MHRRPSAAVAPLPALSLPRPREMSALISGSGSTPHTPTKRAEPLPLFSTNTNRYSTDSWNSSNNDGANEMEVEWKPEQIRLLTRVRRLRRVAAVRDVLIVSRRVLRPLHASVWRLSLTDTRRFAFSLADSLQRPHPTLEPSRQDRPRRG